MAERGKKRDVVVNASFKEQLKQEIKNEIISELNLRPKLIINTSEVKTSENIKTPRPSRKSVRTLIFLVVLVLLLDGISLFVYYHPDGLSMESFQGLIVRDNQDSFSDCSDGTKLDSCSNQKPYFCYEGRLVEMPSDCGCPEGYTRNFQSCEPDN